MTGERLTKPSDFGALLMRSRALNAGSAPHCPLKNCSSRSSAMKRRCVSVFQGCPDKCLARRSISGIILAGVRGDVVTKTVLLLICDIKAISY